MKVPLQPWPLLWLWLWLVLPCSFPTHAAMTRLPCDGMEAGSGGVRTLVVSSDGAELRGCVLVNTDVDLFVPIGSTTVQSIPIRFINIQGQGSSVTVRLVSPSSSSTVTATPAPLQSLNASVEVLVENCTLSKAVDAFVVDVHNATALSNVSLTVRDSLILGTTRGSVSVYRSAVVLGVVTGPGISVQIAVERSTIEVLGTAPGIRCGGTVLPRDYGDPSSAAVPVLCPIYAASVLLTPPDIPVSMSVSSVVTLNVSKVEIVCRNNSNVTVFSLSGSDAYAGTLVRTSQDGTLSNLTSVSIVAQRSVLSVTTTGGIAASGSLVFTDRLSTAGLSLQGTIELLGDGARVTAEDSASLAPAVGLGVSLFGNGPTRIIDANIGFIVMNSDILRASGGPAVAAAGIVLYSVANEVELSRSTVSSAATTSSIASEGTKAISSLGQSLYTQTGLLCRHQRNNVTKSVAGSNVTASTKDSFVAVSSIGIALWGYDGGSSINSDNNISVLVERSNVYSIAGGGYAAVSSIGISIFSHLVNRGSVANDNNITLAVKGSIVGSTVYGTRPAVSSVGIALWTAGSVSNCSHSTISLLVTGSNVTTSGMDMYPSVSSIGVALWAWDGGASVSSDNNISVLVEKSDVASIAGGSYAAVSSVGIALWSPFSISAGSGCWSNQNKITFAVSGSNVTATAREGFTAISSVGVALLSGSNSFSGNVVKISAVESYFFITAFTQVEVSAALFGLSMRPSSSPSDNSFHLQACDVSGTVLGFGSPTVLGAPASSTAVLSLSQVSISSVAPSSPSCLSFTPLNSSTLNDVNVTCPKVGWGPSTVGPGVSAGIYVSKLVVNGMAVRNSSSSQFPGLQSESFMSTSASKTALKALRAACAVQRLDCDTVSPSSSRSVSPSSTLSSLQFSQTLTTSSSPTSSWHSARTTLSTTSTRLRRSTTVLDVDSVSVSESAVSVTHTNAPSIVLQSPSEVATRSLRRKVSGAQSSSREPVTFAVTAASVAASVVGLSLFSSGSIARVPMMKSLTSVINCAQGEEDLDDRPSYLDLPLQFVSIGTNPKLKHYAGGVLLCGLLLLIWEGGTLLCFKILRKLLHPRIEGLLGIVSILWQGYLMPNIVQTAVMVCWLSRTGEDRFVSALVALIVVGVSAFKWLWVLLPRQFATHAPPFSIGRSRDGRTIKVEFTTNGPPEFQRWLRYFEPMFDGSKDPGRLINRVLVAEEVLVGGLLSFLAGIKPQGRDSCQYIAGAMLALTVLHTLYLTVIRPHRTKTDAAFANMNALLLLSQGVLAVVITVQGLSEGSLLTGFGYTGLGLLLLLVVQPLVGGFCSMMLKSRRRVLQSHVAAESRYDGAESDRMVALGAGEGDGNLSSPLLTAPMRTVELNPLTSPYSQAL